MMLMRLRHLAHPKYRKEEAVVPASINTVCILQNIFLTLNSKKCIRNFDKSHGYQYNDIISTIDCGILLIMRDDGHFSILLG